MAKKPDITQVNSLDGITTAINTNFNNVADAFENTLSRDGSTPNQMEADIDMNSNDLLNVGSIDTNTLSINGEAVSTELQAFATDIKYSFDYVSSLLLDERTYKYFVEGDIVEAEGFRYKVAASDATDHHLTTAGGVKLYNLMTTSGQVSIAATAAPADYSESLQRQLNNFGKVVAPAGTYSCSTPVTIPDNGEIEGRGRNDCEFVFSGTGGFILPDTTAHARLTGFKVVGDDTADTVGIEAINNARGVTMRDLFVRRFGGANKSGAGIRLTAGVTADMFGSTLDAVITENNSRGIELIEAGSTTLAGCISRLNFWDALYAENCVALNVHGGAYENPLAGLSDVYNMWLKGCRGFTVSGLWNENGITNLARIENCRGGNFSGYLTNITTVGTLVDVINSSAIIFGGTEIEGINSGDTGIAVDALSRDIDLDGVKYTVFAGGQANSVADIRAVKNYTMDWTPVVRGSGTAGTYELATAEGRAIKRGNNIRLQMKIKAAASVTGGGNSALTIAGLPANYRANSVLSAAPRFVGIPFTGSYAISAPAASTSDNRILFYGVDNIGTSTLVPVSAFGANDEIHMSLDYEV